MKKFILLSVMCAVFFACEKATPQESSSEEGTIVFGKPIESGYIADQNSISCWLMVNDITYTAECSYFEACEPDVITEIAFMDMDSWIKSICVCAKEVVEVTEERVEGDIIYCKRKICCPVLYDDFELDLYYIEERAFASIDQMNFMLPLPTVTLSLVYNREIRQPDMTINGKHYKCYLVEIGISLNCVNKSILYETSFLALDVD